MHPARPKEFIVDEPPNKLRIVAFGRTTFLRQTSAGVGERRLEHIRKVRGMNRLERHDRAGGSLTRSVTAERNAGSVLHAEGRERVADRDQIESPVPKPCGRLFSPSLPRLSADLMIPGVPLHARHRARSILISDVGHAGKQRPLPVRLQEPPLAVRLADAHEPIPCLRPRDALRVRTGAPVGSHTPTCRHAPSPHCRHFHKPASCHIARLSFSLILRVKTATTLSASL